MTGNLIWGMEVHASCNKPKSDSMTQYGGWGTTMFASLLQGSRGRGTKDTKRKGFWEGLDSSQSPVKWPPKHGVCGIWSVWLTNSRCARSPSLVLSLTSGQLCSQRRAFAAWITAKLPNHVSWQDTSTEKHEKSPFWSKQQPCVLTFQRLVKRDFAILPGSQILAELLNIPHAGYGLVAGASGEE